MQVPDIHTPDSIEAALARLMPQAMSEAGQQSIDEMLDDLMGAECEDTVVTQPVDVPNRRKWVVPTGIAASLAMMALFSFMRPGGSNAVVHSIKADMTPGLVLMGEEDRVEDMTDEGWMSDSDGTTMQAVRMRVVQENTMRDEETGMVFQITEPRDELVLIPISDF